MARPGAEAELARADGLTRGWWFERRRRYSPVVEEQTKTLYLLLAEPPPAKSTPGRTIETRTKETVDNDVEALALDLLSDG